MYRNQKKEYINSIILGIIMVLLAMIFTYYVVDFANKRVSSPVGDIILDNIPNLNLFALRFFLPLTSFIITIIILLKNPERFPATLKSLGLLYLIRSVFILVTYLEAPINKIPLNNASSWLSNLPYKGNDLFFSGHVAFPFMVALIFWNHKSTRIIFLTLSFCSGMVVLLGKAHYSIDVLAAPFITYSIYALTKRIWPKDFKYETLIKN